MNLLARIVCHKSITDWADVVQASPPRKLGSLGEGQARPIGLKAIMRDSHLRMVVMINKDYDAVPFILRK